MTHMDGDGHLLPEGTFQFVLLLMGFLELSEDHGKEVFEVGQQVRLVLLQLQPQLSDITFTVREGRTINREWGSEAPGGNMGVPDEGADSWKHHCHHLRSLEFMVQSVFCILTVSLYPHYGLGGRRSMPGTFPGTMPECGPSSLTPVLLSPQSAAAFLCDVPIGFAASSMHGNALARISILPGVWGHMGRANIGMLERDGRLWKDITEETC